MSTRERTSEMGNQMTLTAEQINKAGQWVVTGENVAPVRMMMVAGSLRIAQGDGRATITPDGKYAYQDGH